MSTALMVKASVRLEFPMRIITAASMLVITIAKALTIRNAVEDGKGGGKCDDKNHKSLQAASGKNRFFRHLLIDWFHNSTLLGLNTIPQNAGYVNG